MPRLLQSTFKYLPAENICTQIQPHCLKAYILKVVSYIKYHVKWTLCKESTKGILWYFWPLRMFRTYYVWWKISQEIHWEWFEQLQTWRVQYIEFSDKWSLLLRVKWCIIAILKGIRCVDWFFCLFYLIDWLWLSLYWLAMHIHAKMVWKITHIHTTLNRNNNTLSWYRDCVSNWYFVYLVWMISKHFVFFILFV